MHPNTKNHIVRPGSILQHWFRKPSIDHVHAPKQGLLPVHRKGNAFYWLTAFELSH
jgi:hypothetical protein